MPSVLRTVASCRAVVALAVVACAACAPARAAPAALQLGRPSSLPAVAIAARLSGSVDGLPELTGASLDDVRGRLAALGAVVQVVAFDAAATVSAQYPQPGAPLPTDRIVTVWIGVPPAPPPRAQLSARPAAPATAGVRPNRPTPGSRPATAAPAAPQPTSEPPAAQRPVTSPRAVPRVAPAPGASTMLQGRASWYGPGFAGRRTACGQAFDPTRLTLASRELPCGTVVTVTGPTGATAEATVSDWGPAAWTGRRFDLSQATFAAIHDLGAGVIPVTVRVLR